MSEPWSEVASRITLALAAVEQLLEPDEEWVALGRVEAREAEGDRHQERDGAPVKMELLGRLAARPAYRIRERLIEARRLAQESGGPQGAPALMGSQRPPAEVAAALRLAPIDDLTRIRGIDARLAAELAGAGVQGYAAMASWRAADVRRVSDALGLGRRISRENWIEQAALLAARGTVAASGATTDAEVPPLQKGSADGGSTNSSGASTDSGTPPDIAPIQPRLERPIPSRAPPLPRDILVIEANLGTCEAPVVPDRPDADCSSRDTRAVAAHPTPPSPVAEAPAPPSSPPQPADAGPAHEARAVHVPVAPGTLADAVAGDAGAHSSPPDIAEEAVQPATTAPREPVATAAARAPLQCAAIFAAPLSAMVPFIGPEGTGGRRIAVPLMQQPVEDGARQSAVEARHADRVGPRPAPVDPPTGGRTPDAGTTRPVPPPIISAPGRMVTPRQVLGGRLPTPARTAHPEAAPRSRSEWSASAVPADPYTPAAQPGDEAEVEIVRKGPGERPLTRPEPRGRLPTRTGSERLSAPRAVLMDVEAAEVVIVPRGATPPAAQTPDSAPAARGRLDVSRFMAGWRGR